MVSLIHTHTYLSMFYLELRHLYEVLPEGHNTSALEAGELWEDNTVQLDKKKLSKSAEWTVFTLTKMEGTD